jgi:hypothetical protein
MIEFHFEKAPEISWKDTIKTRIQRGRAVALVNTTAVNARLYYDAVDNKFALQVYVMDLKQPKLLDCELRRQRGGLEMVLMHPNYGGVMITVGNGQLNGSRLSVKLLRGASFFFQVDPCAAHFLQLGKPGRVGSAAPTAHAPNASDEDAQDLSVADLRRLRGEVAIHERKRY